jgi:hypothetical protein
MENEPKFIQTGVEKFGKQSQKRSQVAAADTTWPRLVGLGLGGNSGLMVDG